MDALYFISHLTPLAVICFTVGTLLILVEMINPGIGIPGLMGFALLVLGAVLAARTLAEAIILTLIILGVLGVALSFVIHSAKKGFLSKKIILKNTAMKESGYTGVTDYSDFLGRKGKSLTDLRPAGTADFNGVKFDVVSEGDFIPKGMPVQVVKVEGRRVVVRILEV